MDKGHPRLGHFAYATTIRSLMVGASLKNVLRDEKSSSFGIKRVTLELAI